MGPLMIIKNTFSFFCNKENIQRINLNSSILHNFIVDAAHKKGSGSTKNGRDSVSKRRGVKVYGKQSVNAGGIIVRQVGSTFHPGVNVGSGKDYTLFTLSTGFVMYERIKGRRCVS